MNFKKFVQLSVLVALSALFATGCLSSRKMANMKVNTNNNVTLVETVDIYSIFYLWPYKVTHQYWACGEDGSNINCKKACDAKDGDLVCVSAGLTGGGLAGDVWRENNYR